MVRLCLILESVGITKVRMGCPTGALGDGNLHQPWEGKIDGSNWPSWSSRSCPHCMSTGSVGGPRASCDWLRMRVSGEEDNVDLQEDIKSPLREGIHISQLTKGNTLLTHAKVSCVLNSKWI